MNSRPLVPLSADSDFNAALTPAHFLIGRPLATRPVDLSARDHLASRTLARAPDGVIHILEEVVHRIFELNAAVSAMADCSE